MKEKRYILSQEKREAHEARVSLASVTARREAARCTARCSLLLAAAAAAAAPVGRWSLREREGITAAAAHAPTSMRKEREIKTYFTFLSSCRAVCCACLRMVCIFRSCCHKSCSHQDVGAQDVLSPPAAAAAAATAAAAAAAAMAVFFCFLLRLAWSVPPSGGLLALCLSALWLEAMAP